MSLIINNNTENKSFPYNSISEFFGGLFGELIDRISKLFESNKPKEPANVPNLAVKTGDLAEKTPEYLNQFPGPFEQLTVGFLIGELTKYPNAKLSDIQNYKEIQSLLNELTMRHPKILQSLHRFGDEKFGDHELMTFDQIREFLQPYLFPIPPGELINICSRITLCL